MKIWSNWPIMSVTSTSKVKFFILAHTPPVLDGFSQWKHLNKYAVGGTKGEVEREQLVVWRITMQEKRTNINCTQLNFFEGVARLISQTKRKKKQFFGQLLNISHPFLDQRHSGITILNQSTVNQWVGFCRFCYRFSEIATMI